VVTDSGIGGEIVVSVRAPREVSFGAGTTKAHGIDLRRRLVVLDLVAICAVWIPTAILNAGGDRQAACCIAAGVVTVLAMRAAGLYQSRVCAVRSAEVARALTSAMAGAATYAGLEWIAGNTAIASRLLLGLPVALTIIALRSCFARWLKARRSAGHFLRTVVLVGTNDDAVALWTTLTSEPELGYRIGAVAGDTRDDAPWNELPTSTDSQDLEALAARAGANGVIIVASVLGDNGQRTVDQALRAGLHVQVWPGLSGLASRRIRMTPVSGVPLLYIEPQRTSSWRAVAKRAMDVSLAACLGIAAAPLLLVAALLIKLEDRGPVTYRGQRVGRSGVLIDVLKLRTMVPDAAQMTDKVAALNERTGGPLFKASRDPRITRVGRILRATSIDELPQLWNVLNGTMSLVGPRPALPAEVEQFDAEFRRRHEMRPGMTGLWQIEARDNPSFSAYRRLDLVYLDTWSIGLDIAILGSTAHVVLASAVRNIRGLRAGREQ
jgi:exopolysaccharide biosynthesis polyprenyl glycosylphosphotransferase